MKSDLQDPTLDKLVKEGEILSYTYVSRDLSEMLQICLPSGNCIYIESNGYLDGESTLTVY